MPSPTVESAPDYSDASMIALYPPPQVARTLAINGGLPPADLHLTVVYTGPAVDVDAGLLNAAAEALADRDPITATISGHARFTGNDDGDVIVALVDSPALERLRRDLVDQLTARGVPLPSEHGFCAHITLTYLDPDAESPLRRLPPIPVTFSHLSVVHGADRTTYPFTGEHGLGGLAREAYAMGWAASGGPMTDRVRAGSVAAVRYALDHATDPDVLEVTLHLGHLEGVWAQVFARRLALHELVDTGVMRLWLPMVRRLPWRSLVRDFRAKAGVLETVVLEADGDRPDRDQVADGIAAARQFLAALPEADDWDRLRTVLRDGIARAQAEGTVDALALAADQVGRIGLDFDVAFTDAYNALADLGSEDTLIGEADNWLTRMIGDSATDLGRALARATASGMSYEDMLAEVMGLLDSPTARGARTALDLLTSRAMSAGALRLYGREGVQQVDFATASDQRVCPQCLEAEAGSPYPLDRAPVPGLHPGCRCVTYAADPLPLATLDRYLPGEAGGEEEG